MTAADSPSSPPAQPEVTSGAPSGAPQTLADLKPWQGRATRTDQLLLGALLVVPALMLALTPLKPLLIARHPILLELLTGSNAAIGAAAAFARIGEAPLWLVVLAGVVGSAKFGWLFWLAGRRWGDRVVTLLAPHPRQRQLAERLRRANPWWVRLAVLAGELPFVPAAIVYVAAGWARMRLSVFLAAHLGGALIWTSLIAGLGYGLGQHAVDVVLLVDRYAIWVTVALAVGLAVMAGRKAGPRPTPGAPAGDQRDAA
ncbi:DedA family protein [Desertihabitans brevis]|uniref:DedA family protein n=1 Tax=Desertihabitans brevis TaxID=2268447 RepID=A0A367YTY0_9ACTN|nr:VTT domain-containing protein [Desertihabitans brevis]RCK69250.1 DedA family protein [Desertihabitans brevis]